jgi:hypothetical protein
MGPAAGAGPSDAVREMNCLGTLPGDIEVEIAAAVSWNSEGQKKHVE